VKALLAAPGRKSLPNVSIPGHRRVNPLREQGFRGSLRISAMQQGHGLLRQLAGEILIGSILIDEI